MKLKIKKLKPRNPLVIVVMRKGVRKHKDKRKVKRKFELGFDCYDGVV